MERLVSGAARVAQFGAWFGGALLVLAVLAIAAEVIFRNVAGYSFGAVDELCGYALAIASTWAFAFALVHRTHIRIDTLYVLLPRRLQAGLDLVALLGMIVFFTTVTRFGWDLVARSFSIGQRAMTPLRTPLIFPQLLWFAGLVVLIVIALILLASAVQSLWRGDLVGVSRVAGSLSAQDELQEELAEAERLRGAVPQK